MAWSHCSRCVWQCFVTNVCLIGYCVCASCAHSDNVHIHSHAHPQASAPGIMDKAAPLQKKSYKVLAYLCEHRPGFLRAHVKVSTVI